MFIGHNGVNHVDLKSETKTMSVLMNTDSKNFVGVFLEIMNSNNGR